MYILKSSSKHGLAALQKLNKVSEFSQLNGWDLNTYGDTGTNYLKNNITGHVIMCNEKGWMNESTMIMYIELILSTIKDSNCVMVMDNFACHRSDVVKERLTANGITPLYLPPGSTAIAQPLDVLINGLIKRLLRRKFAVDAYEQVSNFKKQRLTIAGRNLSFKPHNPTLEKGLRNIEDLFKSELRAPEFQKSVKNTFVSIGLTHGPHEEMWLDLRALVNELEIITFNETSNDVNDASDSDDDV